MRQFTQLRWVPVVFFLFSPALAHAADGSESKSDISGFHLIAAALVGLCFAMPVFWKATTIFLKSRSQKAESGKKDDTLT